MSSMDSALVTVTSGTESMHQHSIPSKILTWNTFLVEQVGIKKICQDNFDNNRRLFITIRIQHYQKCSLKQFVNNHIQTNGHLW